MDPLSIIASIASIVGIIGFGVQIAQILQAEIDAVQSATDRVEQIVIEIRATSTGLTNLQDFLIQDIKASSAERIFNDEGRNEVAHIVSRCNAVFRSITVLVSKAGNGVLSSVDHFQRQMEEEYKKKKGVEGSNVKLEIQLSNLEHLMWPWRLPKIEQYIADLDRLKLSLVLILSVANLAKTKNHQKIEHSDAESEKWEGSQAETLVQDEIFYQDRGLQEAEETFKTLTIGPSPAGGVNQQTHVAADILISNWPNSPSGRGISSITELYESGVILEGFAFNPDEHDQTIIEMPINMRSIQQHALKSRHWGSKKPADVWDSFGGLPNHQQEMILEFIVNRKRELYVYDRSDFVPSPQVILISLHITKHRWRRFLEVMKRFANFDPSDAPRRSTFFIVIARVTESRRNGPGPLLSTTTPWRPPSDSGDPYGSDRGYSPSDSDSPSRTRSVDHYRNLRNRSRDRGLTRRLASAAAHGVLAAHQDRQTEGFAEERLSRSRIRSRWNRSSSDIDYPVIDPTKLTYSRVHRKYLSPRTLDEYELPWFWDQDDSNYVIVKRWLPEKDLEILVEHTKLLREKKALVELARGRDNSLQVKKRSPNRASLTANAYGVAVNDSYYHATSDSHPPPPGTTESPKPDDRADDAPPLRRVGLLNELEAHEPPSDLPPPPPPPERRSTVNELEAHEPPSKLPPIPPPGRRATVKEGEDTEPVVGFPPTPRRKTTFREDLGNEGRSLAVAALAALGLRTATGRERRSSPTEENNTARRSTMASSTRDKRLKRGERTSRFRARSRSTSRSTSRRRRNRSRSRPIVPLRTTRRSRRSRSSSRLEGRLTRRTKNGEASMQVYRKSPSRPIRRAFTDDGIPPTQRDKAAVAEYYLKKWTTAYDHVRAQNNRESRYTTRATGRSRSRSRSRYNDQSSRSYNNPSGVEYSNQPVHRLPGGAAAGAEYYSFPPASYNDTNLYQRTVYPSTAAADASAHKAKEKEKEKERERERQSHSSSSGSDSVGRRRHRRREDNSRNTDIEAQTYRLPPTVGTVETVDEEKRKSPAESPSPIGLAVPSSRPAYAESVSDHAFEEVG